MDDAAGGTRLDRTVAVPADLDRVHAAATRR
jgi:hypothetical protein